MCVVRKTTQMMSAGLLLLSATIGVANAAIPSTAWDISDTGQPYVDVDFTLDEGTWMSLDVRPDGRTIAFDLLGDIYALPVTGGDATLLHGGPAMQRQPSYSADGRKLLYISDASGTENAWISNADGSDPQQITHETLDLVMSASWGAQDQSIIVVREGAAFSDMKKSEIRLFDLDGGTGALVVETPANGRDVQEPRVSRDGRYVYYTERLTDPNIYVNANHVNYAIERREFVSGKTEKLVEGWGGAVAPQVSPDGKQLAFVRRVMEKTVLFVYDIATRKQRPLYDKLERDLEADFSQQSAYYPRFAWFPDNLHIAIWGKGKLYRIDASSGEAQEIPFRVQAKHRITQPVRAQQELAPDTVEVRIVRRLAASADGKQLVFNALGHLWTKRLPDGKPLRLTSAKAFEFDPAWSRDGRQLAYVEWDDERGSTLKLAGADGRTIRTLASSRAAIRDPSFSPDGKRLTYRIQTADKVMGGYGTKAGVYWVATAGGESRFVVEGDDVPRFSPDGTRIYYVSTDRRKGELVHVLYSVNLEGLDRHEHAHTLDADTLELRLSPDARWLAFRERQQYYVIPYYETGGSTAISAKSADVPVKALTELGGYALSWATDSSSLQWTLGASLYRANVADFSAPAASVTQPYAQIGLSVAADVPKGALAFTHARLITMKGDEVIEDGTVIVEGNRIVAVGSAAEIKPPAGARIIDASGKTIMPGLIDMHGHNDCCFRTVVSPQKQPSRYAEIAFGVTTNFDPYSSELINYETRETDLAGLTVGPRWIGSGTPAYGRARKTDFTYLPISEYADAQRFMQRKRALGGTAVKSYRQPTRAQRQMLVKAGREAGILVDVEGEGQFYNNVTMILDGHTNLEHNLPMANYYDDLVQLMRRGGMSNTPTLIVNFGELYGENFLYQSERAWEDPKVKLYVQEVTGTYGALNVPAGAPPHSRNMTSIRLADELWDIGVRGVSRSTKKLDDAGVRINVGSHGEIAGLAMHWEMRLFAEGGMSNQHILRAATLNGAITLGVDRQLGSLEPGKLADLIVLDENPLQDIRATNSVRYTLLNGRLYDAMSMNEIGNYDRPRSRFYWELDDYKGIDWNSAWSGK